jgi:hypothetical protein
MDFMASRHWELLIDMLSKSIRNSSSRTSMSLDMQIHKIKKYGNGGPNPQDKGQRKDVQPQDNQPNPPTKKGNGKSKKDTRKWCEFHKIPSKNIDECHCK